jgi:p-aminobenzoyl-glutamate transporter AbgT
MRLIEPDEAIDFTRNVMFPTVWLTKKSPRKWLRSLGRVGVYVPMFPYTVVVCLVVAVMLLFFFILGVTSDEFVDWWESI